MRLHKGEKVMNILLLYFAIPIAVIIFSIALLKILKCPWLVAAVIFAILLVIAFAVFDVSFLVFVILYTFLAYLTAVLVRFLCELLETLRECRENRERRQGNRPCENQNNGRSRCLCDGVTATSNLNPVYIDNNTATASSGNSCDCHTNNNTNVQVAATIRPNGTFCGCYRRR